MSDEELQSQLNSPVVLFSVFIIGALGIVGFQVVPAMAIGMITDLSFNEIQVGRVGSAQLWGIALGALITLPMVKKFRWRTIAYIGIGSIILSDLASIWLNEYNAFIVVRFLQGTAGGICVSFAYYALGNTRLVDRNFGLFLSVQVVIAILANMFLPAMVEARGIAVIFIALVTLEVITLLFLIRKIPNMEVKEHADTGTNDSSSWFYCVSQLLSILCFFIAIGGVWVYLAPIGLDAGLTEQATGRAISIGLFGGLAGSFVAAQLNIKWGRILPVIVSAGIMLAAVALLYSGFDYALFMLAAGLFVFGWYFYFPYQPGTLAEFDRDGRPMILVNFVAGVGSGAGPFVVSIFLEGNFVPAYLVTVTFLILSVLVTVFNIITGRKQMKSA